MLNQVQAVQRKRKEEDKKKTKRRKKEKKKERKKRKDFSLQQVSILAAMSNHDWQQCGRVIECGRDNKRGLLIATYISLLQYIPPIYLQFISIYIYLPPPPTYIFNLSPIYINIYIFLLKYISPILISSSSITLCSPFSNNTNL